MTAVSTRTVSKTWYEVVLPNPTWGAELYLALHFAEERYKSTFGREPNSDDALEVRADDDEIVIRFEIPKEKT